jgi:hypothetical protein
MARRYHALVRRKFERQPGAAVRMALGLERTRESGGARRVRRAARQLSAVALANDVERGLRAQLGEQTTST